MSLCRPRALGSFRKSILSMCGALARFRARPVFHSFEKVFHLDHEDFTRAIIVGDTEVNAALCHR